MPDCLRTQLVQAGEGGQIRGGEGSVKHVEVFDDGRAGTSIIRRPRRLFPQRLAHPCPLNSPAPTPSIVKSQIASGKQGFGGKREAEYRRLTESEVFVSTVLSRVVSCCDA